MFSFSIYKEFAYLSLIWSITFAYFEQLTFVFKSSVSFIIEMRKYIFLLVVSGCVLSVKSHIIKVVILAALGLAGLWLVHLLAQDYQQIQGTKRWLFKRSADEQVQNISSKWSTIWNQDPFGCARSFICQLAANETRLDNYGGPILDFARSSVPNEAWAARELKNAINSGERARTGNDCFKTYKLCPFSAQTMMRILNMFS